MSHLCGRELVDGTRCRHPVSDPAAPDCGRHRFTVTQRYDLGEQGCRVRQVGPGSWRCLTHEFDDPRWQAARALGAHPPCRIPSTVKHRQMLATQEEIDPHTLWLLLADPERSVRANLAANENVPGWALEHLARDSTDWIRSAIAGNRHTPVSALADLAEEEHSRIQHIVASNPAAPPAALLHLAQKPDTALARSIVAHPHTPESVLQRWAHDRTMGTVWHAARVRLTQDPEELLQASLSNEWFVLTALALNLACPAHLLQHLLTKPELDLQQVMVERLSQSPPEAS